MAVVGLLSLMVTWWASPFDRVTGTAFERFDQRDIVPSPTRPSRSRSASRPACSSGERCRRWRLRCSRSSRCGSASPTSCGRHLLAPKTLAAALDPDCDRIRSNRFRPRSLGALGTRDSERVDSVGPHRRQLRPRHDRRLPCRRPVPQLAWNHGRQPTGNRTQVPKDAKTHCTTASPRSRATYHQVVTYQPASRYWTFQWIEFGIYLAAAAVLVGICVWSVRRRRVNRGS